MHTPLRHPGRSRTAHAGARRLTRLTIVALTLALAGCGGDDESRARDEERETDHVWKGQTQTIDKARDVERQLRESRQQ